MRRLGDIGRLWLILREGLAVAWSQPAATSSAALVIAAACAVIGITAGQVAVAQERVIGRIDEAGTRLIEVTDERGRAGLRAGSVVRVQALEGVRWVIGLGAATDAANAALGKAGRPVPTRVIYGDLPFAVSAGRAARPGEALVGPDALTALNSRIPALGVMTGERRLAVVGTFDATDPLEFLDRSILIVPHPASAESPIRGLYVLADDPAWVDDLEQAIRAVVRADVPSELTYATPSVLAELRAIVGGELAANARTVTLGTLAVGVLIVAITIAGAVSLRRRDFGRRRALGASRSAVMLLVLVQSAVAAAVGIVAGTAVAIVVLLRISSAPPVGFTVGVAGLVLLMALAAGVPPGLLAAMRDPVRILRVP